MIRFFSPQYSCPIPKPWATPIYQEWLVYHPLPQGTTKFKQGIRGLCLFLVGLKSWCKLFIHNGASFLQTPGFFCTLVHRSALDFEPGTKRHNIWYPVQELLEMLPYGWAKIEPIPLVNGRLFGQGGENGKEKNLSSFFLLEWKWKWEYKVLFFNPPNTRKHLKNLPWCFWKQHIQNASKDS